MRIRTCIRKVARERGTTAAALARRLGLYRSNISALDAGTRACSLRALAQVAAALGCSPGELLERVPEGNPAVFRAKELNARLAARQAAVVDGTERGWVHTALLAWQRHYRARR